MNYLSKDQNFQNASTTYWFELDGETYGVVEGEDAGIVDCDGCPITGAADEEEISNALENAVTEDMRAE